MKKIALIFAVALGLSTSVFASDSTCNDDHKLDGDLFSQTKVERPVTVSQPTKDKQQN